MEHSRVNIADQLIQNADEISRCAEDPFYFATRYCYTQTAEPGQALNSLYPKWEYLEDIFQTLDNSSGNYLWIKSRQMLLTWTVCVFQLHRITFHSGYRCLNISRKEALVCDGGDQSTTNSIHGRIRFMWKKLPPWLQADLTFAKLKIINQSHNMDSTIVGESANADAGRSGSYVDIFADEFAAIEPAEQVHAALSGCTFRSRHYISTPKQGHNTFTRLLDDPTSGFRTMRLHWTARPDRDEKWYKEKIRGLKPSQIAEEFDMNPHGAADDMIFPDFDVEKHAFELADLPRIIHWIGGQDWGWSHPGALLIGGIDEAGNVWVTQEFVKSRVQVREYDGDEISKDCWVGKALQFDLSLIVAGHERPGDIEIYNASGLHCQKKEWDFSKGVEEISKKLLGENSRRLYISTECAYLLSTMPNQVWAKDKFDVQLERPVKKDDHACDALRYLMEAADALSDSNVFFDLEPLEDLQEYQSPVT